MDDDLEICSEDLDDNMDTGVISSYGLSMDAPGRRTPDFNTWCCVITTDIWGQLEVEESLNSIDAAVLATCKRHKT